jgi:hypothetical protein
MKSSPALEFLAILALTYVLFHMTPIVNFLDRVIR